MNDKNKLDEIENEELEIIEVPQKEDQKVVSQSDSDYVLSEASVGLIEGISFTVSGLVMSTEEDEGEGWTAYFDIEKSRFVDFWEGTEFELKEGVNLKVLKIEKADHDAKGKIYLKRL